MKKLFLALVMIHIIQPAYGASIWYCLNDSASEENQALVLYTGLNQTISVFDNAGVKKFDLQFEYTGLNQDVHVYRAVHDKYMFLFMKVKDENKAGFSVIDLETDNTALWICK
jgi:hypothetical protein